MKWKENKWLVLISFFGGALVCFILTQFTYFEVKKELDVVFILMGVLTLLVALHIAGAIQLKLNRNQNRYSLLVSKLNKSWSNFFKLSKSISADDKLQVESLAKINTDIIYEISFLKNIFDGFTIDSSCISALESQLDEFESLFEDLPTVDNIIFYKEKKELIESNIININHYFTVVLNKIEKLE